MVEDVRKYGISEGVNIGQGRHIQLLLLYGRRIENGEIDMYTDRKVAEYLA